MAIDLFRVKRNSLPFLRACLLPCCACASSIHRSTLLQYSTEKKKLQSFETEKKDLYLKNGKKKIENLVGNPALKTFLYRILKQTLTEAVVQHSLLLFLRLHEKRGWLLSLTDYLLIPGINSPKEGTAFPSTAGHSTYIVFFLDGRTFNPHPLTLTRFIAYFSSWMTKSRSIFSSTTLPCSIYPNLVLILPFNRTWQREATTTPLSIYKQNIL